MGVLSNRATVIKKSGIISCELPQFSREQLYPPKTNMTMENHKFLIGDTSSNGCFSIVMLVFRGVLEMLLASFFFEPSKHGLIQ